MDPSKHLFDVLQVPVHPDLTTGILEIGSSSSPNLQIRADLEVSVVPFLSFHGLHNPKGLQLLSGLSSGLHMSRCRTNVGPTSGAY
ncbi:hypothetical protein SCLCIDRAFT_1221388 [Scleroderma citrinum Foug A]|uniref:Uncharacterized protein n=1 Tax=Scleroderma citrinum Foug A TaxID=1036808 RepID=A0A0C3D2V2_9AGAM|nr:hypothetical protein SCLCIDRAFT_1221388 [Scleroderma citrinum Foug A]